MRCGVIACLAVFLTLSWGVAANDSTTPSIQEDYRLTVREGPWMIYVASYQGDDAARMAAELLHELRQRYRLDAYVYSRSEVERKERDQEIERIRKQYGEDLKVKRIRVLDEYAVLVGNYKSMDAARKALDKVKNLEPPKEANVPRIAAGRPNPKALSEKWDSMNPFKTAFVVRNPLVPRDTSSQNDLDVMGIPWMKLNFSEKHSIFNNRKQWTVVVKAYGGHAAPAAANKTGFWDEVKSLVKADGAVKFDEQAMLANAAQARKLAEMLRSSAYNLDAYVFHSMNSTFVTVGGFDDPKDPEMLRMQKQLAGMVVGTERLMDQPGRMLVPKPHGPSAELSTWGQ